MCGISGILTFGKALPEEENMMRYASWNLNRGRDCKGYHIEYSPDFNFFISHYRLSILDLTEAGKQPMQNRKGDIFIVFNGEIYNYQDIKNKLVGEGASFTSRTDTEVILMAYECWGIEKTLEMLKGMFAFCIIDTRFHCCFIARDVFGKKPLYYHLANGVFSFSSDIRSFKELNIDLNINLRALSYYFSELSTPEHISIFENIGKLNPGHYLKISEKGLETIFFKSLKFCNALSPESYEMTPKIEDLLLKAIKTRMVADVPVVGLLSGGIDSGLITAIAASNSSKRISTYTVGYPDYPMSELPFARMVAQKYDTLHHEVILSPDNVSIANELIMEFGEPFADSSMIPVYYVCSALSGSARVALSGDGGDELFLGYPTYYQAYIMQNRYRHLQKIRFFMDLAARLSCNKRLKYISGILSKDSESIGSALYRNMGFSPWSIMQLFKDCTASCGVMEQEFERLISSGRDHFDTVFNGVWYGTFKTRLLNDYLVKIDRSSMFASVEMRSPYLDDDLLDYVSSLDYRLLMPGGKLKGFLLSLAARYLPEQILQKPKTGFGIPVGDWFRGSWKERFRETVLDPEGHFAPLNYKYIESIFAEHLHYKPGNVQHDDKIWALYVFHYWLRNFFGQKPQC